MRSSEQWPKVKQMLRQAVVILEEIQIAMSRTAHINKVTKNKIAQAKQNISESLEDTVTCQQISSLIEYESLIKKLKVAEMPITLEELEEADKL
jgi:hypothetical protein